MPQSLAKILVRLICSRRNGQRVIQDDIQDGLHRHIAEMLKVLESPAIFINSVEDHVHILYSPSKHVSARKLVREVKKSSAKWIKSCGPNYSEFQWQKEYDVFPVGESDVGEVVRCLQSRPVHQKRKSFQAEYRDFLKRYDLAYEQQHALGLIISPFHTQTKPG
jgi:REP-associated tyrosine transposase